MSLRCSRCGADLPSDALVCRRCHALVHGEKLEELAASARRLEEQRKFSSAREEWLQALEMLPKDSAQAGWIDDHLRVLQPQPDVTSAPRESRWPGWLAPAAPVLAALFKGKALVALFDAKFILSLGGFLAVYWSLFGMWFGAGFAVQVALHEMGHYVDIKRRGLPADVPIFLPGFGAFVRWGAMGVSLETRALVSLAGPLAGWFAAAACAGVWLTTRDPFWAALARSGAWLNLLNLIPVWALDGGQAFYALKRTHRGLLLALSMALFFVVGDGVLFLMALGSGWRLFTKDLPEQPSASTASYFVALLCGLAGLMWLLPGEGFGAP